MTGRQLIDEILNTTEDLDKEIPVFVLVMSAENVVSEKRRYMYYSFINGKLFIENNFKVENMLI